MRAGFLDHGTYRRLRFAFINELSRDHMSNDAKLAQLRARTDRELLVLIERDVDRRLALAEAGQARGTALHAEGEKACREFNTLLLKTPAMRPGARVRVGAKLSKLRLMLDHALAIDGAEPAPVVLGS